MNIEHIRKLNLAIRAEIRTEKLAGQKFSSLRVQLNDVNYSSETLLHSEHQDHDHAINALTASFHDLDIEVSLFSQNKDGDHVLSKMFYHQNRLMPNLAVAAAFWDNRVKSLAEFKKEADYGYAAHALSASCPFDENGDIMYFVETENDALSTPQEFIKEQGKPTDVYRIEHIGTLFYWCYYDTDIYALFDHSSDDYLLNIEACCAFGSVEA